MFTGGTIWLLTHGHTSAQVRKASQMRCRSRWGLSLAPREQSPQHRPKKQGLLPTAAQRRWLQEAEKDSPLDTYTECILIRWGLVEQISTPKCRCSRCCSIPIVISMSGLCIPDKYELLVRQVREKLAAVAMPFPEPPAPAPVPREADDAPMSSLGTCQRRLGVALAGAAEARRSSACGSKPQPFNFPPLAILLLV